MTLKIRALFNVSKMNAIGVGITYLFDYFGQI